MKTTFIIISGIIIIIVLGLYFTFIKGFYAWSDKVVGEYHGSASIEVFEGNEEWEIGENKYVQPIFVDYKKAMDFTKNEYADVIDKAYKMIHEDYKLEKLSNSNLKIYTNLIYKMPSENEEERQRNFTVAGFLDIYENSLKRWIYIPGIGWERIVP